MAVKPQGLYARVPGFIRLERLSDREFEANRAVLRPSADWNTPFETKRSEWREPPQAEADRVAKEAVNSTWRGRGVGLRRERRLAVAKLIPERKEVPGVAAVVEDHSLDANRFDEWELEFDVVEALEVATDRPALRDDGEIRVACGSDTGLRADRLQSVTANREDTTEVEALEYRDRFTGRDQPELGVDFEDHGAEHLFVEPRERGLPDEGVVGPEVLIGDLDRIVREDAARGGQSVVATVPVEREPQRAGDAVTERVSDEDVGERVCEVAADAEQVSTGLGDIHVLEFVPEKDTETRIEEGMSRGEVRARRVLSEIAEVSNALEYTEPETPFGPEEPRLDEVQVDLLPDARNLQVQAERLAASK